MSVCSYTYKSNKGNSAEQCLLSTKIVAYITKALQTYLLFSSRCN